MAYMVVSVRISLLEVNVAKSFPDEISALKPMLGVVLCSVLDCCRFEKVARRLALEKFNIRSSLLHLGSLGVCQQPAWHGRGA
eukprot:4775206-Amphidinium_carterae.1